MSFLVAPETGSPQSYSMKVMDELLVQAHIAGIDVEEFVGFFATQIHTMFAAPPNFNMFGETAKVWIMRGFYPGTKIFFKIVLLPTKSDNGYRDSFSYYAKVSPFRAMRKKHKHGRVEGYCMFNGEHLDKQLEDRMENSLLGGENVLTPLIDIKLRMPRCMSPKGLKIFNLEKPKKGRKKRARTSS